jgi:hypothetical protein
VKRFRVETPMDRTKVAADRPPLRVWSFGVKLCTGVLAPMVVEQGDRVDGTFVHGGSGAMHVDMPRSLDMHAAEIAPNRAFKTIPAGATTHYRFVARHPGVLAMKSSAASSTPTCTVWAPSAIAVDWNEKLSGVVTLVHGGRRRSRRSPWAQRCSRCRRDRCHPPVACRS